MRTLSKTSPLLLAVILALCTSTVASAQSFFANFLKPEYLIPVAEFPATSGGDLNVVYYQVQIPVVSNGELLILGEYPLARYFSITAYDDHGAIVSTLQDTDIQPYGSAVNPVPGGGAEDVLYAVTVRMGDGLATNPVSQCATPLSVHENVLDARNRHTAGTYYSADQSGFSASVASLGTVTHVDAPANSGTFLLIRSYLPRDPDPGSVVDLRRPLVWLRASGSGCAPQLAPAGQRLPLSQWFSLASVLKLDQIAAHLQHETDLGTQEPFGPDPVSDASWIGLQEYQPGQAVGQLVAAVLPIDSTGYPDAATALNAQGRILQLRFRLPMMACYPSATCSGALTGAEDLRYWSLTLEDRLGVSLDTISDAALNPDPDGNVDLVVSFGASVPSYVTPANGYSLVTLPTGPLYRVVLRNLGEAAGFGCSTQNVPPRTAEYHPNGGYMGVYAPVVTLPVASNLPVVATPPGLVESCQYP